MRYDELLADPERCVTQAYLVEGRNRVRVYQPRRADRPRDFAGVAATLEDAYLVAIKTGRLAGSTEGSLRGQAQRAVAKNGDRFSTGQSPSEVIDERILSARAFAGFGPCSPATSPIMPAGRSLSSGP